MTQLMINAAVAIVVIAVIVALSIPQPMKCPACGKHKLQLRYGTKSNPPRHRYYRCKGCGARFRRMFTSPFEDASDPEFNRFFDEADAFFGDSGNRSR
jgi:transposase-like protein